MTMHRSVRVRAFSCSRGPASGWHAAFGVRRHEVIAALVVACAAAACKTAHPAGETPAASSSAAEAPAKGASATARLLGLTKNEGSLLVDIQIAAAQALIHEHPDVRDQWIALGRLWVRKARDAA